MRSICGNRLGQLRAERNLTQDQLAEIAGVSRVSYTRYENGTRTPKTAPLLKMAEFFDVDPAYIIGDAEERRPPQTINKEAECAVLFEQLTSEEKKQAEMFMQFLLSQRKQ